MRVYSDLHYLDTNNENQTTQEFIGFYNKGG